MIGNSPVRGPDNASVTIVEFADMQCPHCIAEWPKLRQMLEEYPQEVRVVFKHYPLAAHNKAKPVHAAMEFALRQAGPETFWKMHDMIISSPQKLDPNDLRVYAELFKLDTDALDALLTDRVGIDQLLRSDLLEARRHGVHITPTIFINGRRLGDRTIEAYRARINQILSEVEAKK